MKTQQRVTVQPAFGTRFYVPKKTHTKLLSNVEKYASGHKWESVPSKEEALKNMKSLYKAIFEHNSNPANHILDNSKVKISNIEVDKRCTSTIYFVETEKGERHLLNQGEHCAHGILQNIQRNVIDAKKMTMEEKAQMYLAKILPPEDKTSSSLLRRIYDAIINKPNQTK